MIGVGYAVRGSTMFTIWKSRDVSNAIEGAEGRLHFVLVPGKVLVTRIANSYLLRDAEVRKGKGLRRALLVEYAPTITTVMFSVGERERVPTPKTNIRLYPLWCSFRVNKGRPRDGEIFRRKVKA
jgi:hypothetical protein